MHKLFLMLRRLFKYILFCLIAISTGLIASMVVDKDTFESWHGLYWEYYDAKKAYTLKPPLSKLNLVEYGVITDGHDSYDSLGINIHPDDLYEINLAVSNKNTISMSIGGPEMSNLIATYLLEYDDLKMPQKSVFLLFDKQKQDRYFRYKDLNGDAQIDMYSIILNDETIRYIFYNEQFHKVLSTSKNFWWIELDQEEVPLFFDGNSWVICDPCEGQDVDLDKFLGEN